MMFSIKSHWAIVSVQVALVAASISACAPQFPQINFPEDPSHDYDHDGQTEAQGDCNDIAPNAYLGATEYCDGIDNNCDGEVDEDNAVNTSSWYPDGDGDGFGNAAYPFSACEAPPGYVSDATDCHDDEPTVYPGAPELCDNGLDNDCDGLVDDADPDMQGFLTWYRDYDHDGAGDPEYAVDSCDDISGFVLNDEDCDDTTAQRSPYIDEVCDGGIDNDCDDLIDDEDPSMVGEAIWYYDYDEDLYGSDDDTLESCVQPDGYVFEGGDCNDADPDIRPFGAEVCNEIDDDCDDDIDEDVTPRWYGDADGDGYGDPGLWQDVCEEELGWVDNDADCNDQEPLAYTGATELCDGADNDCDGSTDPDDTVDCVDWYYDSDSDGYGLTTTRICSCDTAGRGFYVAPEPGDCDDADADAYPQSPISPCGLMGNIDVSVADVQFSGGTTGAGVTTGARGRDLDGDGYVDLVIGDVGYNGGQGALFVYFGPIAAGSFDLESDADLVLTGSGWLDESFNSVFMVEDFDGDGVDDLWVSDESMLYQVDLAGGSGTMVSNYVDSVSLRSSGSKFGVGDFDGDGAVEIVEGTNSQSGIWQIYGSSLGLISFSSTNLRCTSPSTLLTDVTGDGVDDLGCLKGSIYSLYTGLFVPHASITDTQFGVLCSDSLMGDYNGDGVGDLVIGDQSASVTGAGSGMVGFFYGPISGDRTSLDTEIIGSVGGVALGYRLASGDYNGDGDTDLVVSAENIGHFLFYGPIDTGGSLSESDADAFFNIPSLAVTMVGDLNNDGYDDVMFGGVTNSVGSVYIFFGASNSSN